METCCERVEQALVEIAGELDLLDEPDRAHVAQCSQCAEVASNEVALSGLLAQVLPPADEALEKAILGALPGRRLRWRLVSLLPVAASLLVALVGAVLVGGVPGSSFLALLPAWSTQGWLGLAGVAGEWSVVLVATARAAGSAVPLAGQLTAGLLSFVGFAATLLMARRWRKSLLWSRTD